MPTVGFSSNNTRVMEGNSGATQATLTLELSTASTNPVTVTYTTMLRSYGDATPGVDYVAQAQSKVTFAPGEVTKQITVEVLGDTLYEADENFYVDLLSATGATLVLSGAEGLRSPWQTVYITNDDPAFSVPNVIKGSALSESWHSTLENDHIDGGAGADVVIWAKNVQNYTLNFVNGLVVVQDSTGAEGTDFLTSVEKLQFADKAVIVESKAHSSYEDLPVDLYQFFIAAFNAAPGVTYMDQLAEAYRYGLSVKQIVDIFTTKTQFTDVYPTSLTHAELAQALVNNIVKTSASDSTKQAAVKDITDAMDLAHWTVGQVIYQVFGNLDNFAYSDTTWGNTARQFANEIAVAMAYTDTLSQSTTDLATLRSVIEPVSHLSDVSTPELQISLIGQALLVLLCHKN